jgi:sulfite reductase alpha subunit-like flavoprotein
MAPDVRRAFATIVQGALGLDAAAAERRVDDLAATGRYLVDVWAAG